MTHVPPPAEELRLLDAELWHLDARRLQLLNRRAWLVSTLQSAAQLPARQVPPAQPPRPEPAAPRVQNMLLLLGGVLLTIAAMVFTLVSWGHLGITGRALVLGALTLAVLATPLPLLRRGLRSTAESVAGLGLALTALDAYALHETAFTGTDGTAYAAAATAVLATVWAAYDRALTATSGPLRLPLPAALTTAQLPLLLWAIAADAGAYGVTAALLLTAGLDTIVALRGTAGSVRFVAALGAYGTGAWGALTAGWLTWDAAGPSAAARAAALLTLAAAIAVGAAWRGESPADGDTATSANGTSKATAGGVAAGVNAVAGGLLLVAAVGGLLRTALPGGWTVPGYLACGVALLGALRAPLPATVRRGFVQASAAVQAVAVACALPLVSVALLGPLGWTGRAWSGVPADARAAVTADTPWPPHPAQLLLAPVVVAAVLLVLARSETWRPRATTGATVLLWATAMAVAPTLQLPYTVALLLPAAVTVATLAAAAFRPRPLLPTALALATSVVLAFLALPSEAATLTLLSVLTALFATASLRPHLAPVTAPTALVHATALACATGAAADWSPQYTALPVLAIPVAAALLAPRLAHARVPVEVTGAAAALLAIGLAVTDPPMLALVLALCGVIAAGTAVRPDRRAVGYAAAALFVLATWVRLAAWDVGTPEAYTLPVTIPALLVGALRRSRAPQTSSWTAYAPGLTATLLPSLAAAWDDVHWTRPLLLGTAALLITVLGARHRLQAPLVLGGSVLALDALHELAPYLVQMTDTLPRWVPPALAGLLLLALGATYERRIRDVRRVREVLGRMN
ncbi:SCO7613 C-terminal domain-containing membrane protein [Streptomyces sp. CA-249302]|uniref:SCO7613 C-terminal domain-containing membrane protein n=1 Tax=Streptomyces sp. CA-249302 TaxID=3240058 RepID=UPI003D91D31A